MERIKVVIPAFYISELRNAEPDKLNISLTYFFVRDALYMTQNRATMEVSVIKH